MTTQTHIIDPKTHITSLCNVRINDNLWCRLALNVANFASGLLPGRFFNELLQNIDDAKGKSIQFTLISDVLKVEHDGKHFSYNDVEKIVDFADQTITEKSKASDVTGYKGIGFKSLLTMAWKVQIISGGYSFRFDKKHWDKPLPWEMIPIWTEEKNFYPEKVTFIFHLNNPKVVESELNKFCRNPSSILYLRNVRILILTFDKTNKVVSRKDVHPNTISISPPSCLRSLMDSGFFRSIWNINSSPPIGVPSKIRLGLQSLNSTLCPDSLKNGKNPVVITFGFLCTDNDNNNNNNNNDGLIALTDSTEIYATLPTKLRLGLPFTVNSEFLLEAQRESLISHSWNNFLFEKLAYFQFFFLKELATTPYWKSILKVLGPSSINTADQNLNKAYAMGYKQGAKAFAWIPSFVDQKQLLKFEEGCIDKTKFYYVLKDKLPKEVIPKNLVHPELKNLEKLEKSLEALNHQSIINSLEKIFQKDKNPELCFHVLSFFKTRRWSWNEIKDTSFVLTEDGTLEKLSNLSFAAEGETPKPPAFIQIPLINKTILSFDKKGDVKKWLIDQGIRPISAKSIVQQYIIKFVEEKKVDENNTLALVEYLFQLYAAGLIQDKDLKALKNMPMSNFEGKLAPVKDLFLSADYVLQQKPDLKTILPINLFIHPGYKKNIEDARWADFLRALGAQEKCSLGFLQSTTVKELETLKLSYLDEFWRYIYNFRPQILTRGKEDHHKYRNFFYFPMMGYLTQPGFSDQFWQSLSDYGKNFIEYDRECKFIDGNNRARVLCSPEFNKNSYIKYVLNTKFLIPGTDGKFHVARELYVPSFRSLNVKGIVAADLKVSISDGLAKYLGFKTKVPPKECFSLLQEMSNNNNENINLDLYIDVTKNLISGWEKLEEKEKQELLMKKWYFLANNNSWQPIGSLKYFAVKGVAPSLQSNQWFKNVVEEMYKLAQIFNRPIVTEYVQKSNIGGATEDLELRTNIFNKLPLVAWIRGHFLMKPAADVLKSLVNKLKSLRFFQAKSILSTENHSIDLIQVEGNIYFTEKCAKQRIYDKVVECFEFDYQGTKDFLEILSLKPKIHTRKRKTEDDWIKERNIPEMEIQKLRELLKTLDPTPSLTTQTTMYSPHVISPPVEKKKETPTPDLESPYKPPEKQENFPIERPTYKEGKEEEEDSPLGLQNLAQNLGELSINTGQMKTSKTIPKLPIFHIESKQEEDPLSEFENPDLFRELFPISPNEIKPQDEILKLKTPNKKSRAPTEKSNRSTSSYRAPPSETKTTEIGRWGEMFALKELIHKYSKHYLKKYNFQVQKLTSSHYKWSKGTDATHEIELKWVNAQKETGSDHDFELIKTKFGVSTTYPIEIKATTGSKVHFFMPDSEKKLMDSNPKKYRLYVVLHVKSPNAVMHQIDKPKAWVENSIINTHIKYEVENDMLF